MQSPIVVVLAAGKGTRMKSETAKVLFPVAGKALIAWAVDTARQAGAETIVTVLGHQRDKVAAYLAERYPEAPPKIAVQEPPKGTGHAIQVALPTLASLSGDRMVVIVSGDAPLLPAARISELVAAAEASPAKMALLSTRAPRPMPYGRVVRGEHGRAVRIVEAKDASASELGIEELNAGFYAVALEHLRTDLQTLDSNNAQGELYLTDLAASAAQRGGAAVVEAPWAEVSGINDRIDLAEVDRAARLAIAHAFMREGVSIPAPEQTFIEADVLSIGNDSWIGPGVHLRGKTTVGTGVVIDTGTVITDCSIADGAWIKPHCVLSESQVGERAQIGPFAHLRPGTQLDEDTRVGNFVETKKAHLQSGAKANHLAYLGDASVGARANIGAGTITCNYDGFAKYKTVIEADAFIGSDSQLVAPVTVGKGAYVGSGTTVTKDVPRSALALSRVKQVNKEGWADQFREVQNKRKSRKG